VFLFLYDQRQNKFIQYQSDENDQSIRLEFDWEKCPENMAQAHGVEHSMNNLPHDMIYDNTVSQFSNQLPIKGMDTDSHPYGMKGGSSKNTQHMEDY